MANNFSELLFAKNTTKPFFCNRFVNAKPILISFDTNVASEIYGLPVLTKLLIYHTPGDQLVSV